MLLADIPCRKLYHANIFRVPEKEAVWVQILREGNDVAVIIQNKNIDGYAHAKGVQSPPGGKSDGRNGMFSDKPH